MRLLGNQRFSELQHGAGAITSTLFAFVGRVECGLFSKDGLNFKTVGLKKQLIILGWSVTRRMCSLHIAGHVSVCSTLRRWGNPKLLRLYADVFYSMFVPECVPYIIPHMFQ